MGKTGVNSEYQQEDSHYFTTRILNSKPASAKMGCFHETLTLLLFIAILMAVRFQETSATGQGCFSNEQCPSGHLCNKFPRMNWGLCEGPQLSHAVLGI